MKRTIFTHHLKKYAKTIQGKSDNQLRGYMDGYIKALEVVKGELLGLAPQTVDQDFQSKGYKYFFEEIQHMVNLEVPGSSPGWSTFKIRHLQGSCRCFSFRGDLQVTFLKRNSAFVTF